ncbi:HEAT repeat domain-containing protein [Geomonas sp. Red32]|uniref:HEAT repeat domain-containing protein n=1 Tax=Geomonas sp. Red32 TaxID=2912856 RepID=UPI00202CCDE8|nr:HEAT repeat domain-containing protein [Geomonas sp. Red32]
MTGSDNRQLRLVTSEKGSLLGQGLVDLYKAVKGASFYPQGHPYRVEPLQRAYEALLELTSERELALTVNRQGFFPGGEGVDGNASVQQLAYECFIRRIANITFMNDLSLADLEQFVDLLATDPYKTAAAGGVAAQLEEAGSRTVWVNEKDLAAIWAKRGVAGSTGGEEGAAGAGEESEGWEGISALAAVEQVLGALNEGPGLEEILRMMAVERHDRRYQELGRQLVERFRATPEEAALMLVLQELLRQRQDHRRSLPQREYALFTLERIADLSTDTLLDHLESREWTDKEGLQRVFSALGVKGAYWIIQRLCLAEGVYERKALATALVRLGTAAVAPVTAMLKDKRWFVVRNMVTILGELRSRDSIPTLKGALYHPDQRVRKEAIRSLMKIGGDAAESLLTVALEAEDDEAIARHLILSLGLMKSRHAVPLLLRLLERRDFLLKSLPVKKEVAASLGRIGDRRATQPLMKIVRSLGFPVFGRWQELKVAAVTALGQLGDEAALPLVAGLAGKSGPVSEAAREAVDAIERVSGGDDE